MNVTGITRSIKGLLIAIATFAIVAASAVLLTHHNSSGWQASAAQTSLARKIAMQEATSLNPGGTASADAIAANAGWPTNVKSVRFAAGTHQSAIALTGASGAPDDRDVLVIQMTGTFQIEAISVPQGVSPLFTRHELILIVDATSGEVLDFSAGESAAPLANSDVLKAGS